MNTHQARDASRDYARSVADKFLADAESNPEVTAAAHAEAVAQVRAEQAAEFAMKVAEIEKTVRPDGPNQEE